MDRDQVLQRLNEAARRCQRVELRGDDYHVIPATEPMRFYREEEIEPIVNLDGIVDLGDAKVTINSYGAAILNAPHLLIADIDDVGLVHDSLGPGKLVECLVQRQAKYSNWNIYDTLAGYRAICLNRARPIGVTAIRTLAELRSDPLYLAMCLEQNCYRARLTKKPWREGDKIALGGYVGTMNLEDGLQCSDELRPLVDFHNFMISECFDWNATEANLLS